MDLTTAITNFEKELQSMGFNDTDALLIHKYRWRELYKVQWQLEQPRRFTDTDKGKA